MELDQTPSQVEIERRSLVAAHHEAIADAETRDLLDAEEARKMREDAIGSPEQFGRRARALRQQVRDAERKNAHENRVAPIRRKIVRAVHACAARRARLEPRRPLSRAREHRPAPSRRAASSRTSSADPGGSDDGPSSSPVGQLRQATSFLVDRVTRRSDGNPRWWCRDSWRHASTVLISRLTPLLPAAVRTPFVRWWLSEPERSERFWQSVEIATTRQREVTR